jgi:pimeloyl-ACP methyl ester carboxylesterase
MADRVPTDPAAVGTENVTILSHNFCEQIDPTADRFLFFFTVVATNRKTEMAIKPSIVLVHGFWGGAAHWAKVIVQLSKLGYESLGAVENPLTSLADDAERTGKMLAQQQGPVLLVGHSYGGAVITAAGNQPNVVGLVYIAAARRRSGLSGLRALPMRRPIATGMSGSTQRNFTRASVRISRLMRRWSWRSLKKHPSEARSPTRSRRRRGKASRPGTRFRARIG